MLKTNVWLEMLCAILVNVKNNDKLNINGVILFSIVHCSSICCTNNEYPFWLSAKCLYNVDNWINWIKRDLGQWMCRMWELKFYQWLRKSVLNRVKLRPTTRILNNCLNLFVLNSCRTLTIAAYRKKLAFQSDPFN